MKMNINELRKLINERLSLLNQLKEESSLIKQESLKIKIKGIEQKLAPNSENIEIDLHRLFKVSDKILNEKLVKFFKEKDGFSEDNLPVSLKKVIVRLQGKLYVLWDVDDFSNGHNDVSLHHLYNGEKNFSWIELMQEYPEIEDILWACINETNNKQKFNKVSLIKQIIMDKQEKLNVLTNPKKLEQVINNLINEINEKNNELNELEPVLNEIEI